MQAKASIFALLALSGPAWAEDPLSAIDWLEENPPTVAVAPKPAPVIKPKTNEPATSRTAITPEITVTPLDATSVDAVGLLPSNVTGLPGDLWRNSSSKTLQELIKAQRTDGQPAMTAMLYTLLLAEAEAPRDSGTDTGLLLARVDKLIDLGAAEPAEALLARANPETPALFSRWFDLSLLNNNEDSVCRSLIASPHLAPGYEARVFCAARQGDWMTAALILDTAVAIGAIPQRRADLLERFLDPELAEDRPALRPPVRPTPLEFRLFEALGEALSTATLPRVFSNNDLRGDSGWKAQLEAAERLARVGAISDNRLLGIYTARLRAASGGIWDRVEALQRFEQALKTGDPTAISSALQRVWPQMRSVGLEVPFAQLFGESLATFPLTEAAKPLGLRVALLSPDYEVAAAKSTINTDQAIFWKAVAQGEVSETSAYDDRSRAVAKAFEAATPPAPLTRLLEQGKLGEVILRAIALYGQGIDGDPADVTDALATFRAVGLEDTARRAALQLLLLEGRV